MLDSDVKKIGRTTGCGGSFGEAAFPASPKLSRHRDVRVTQTEPTNNNRQTLTINNQSQLIKTRQLLDLSLPPLRLSPITSSLRPDKLNRPPDPRIPRPTNKLTIMLPKTALKISGHTGIQRVIGAAQEIDEPGLVHGDQASARTSFTQSPIPA